MSHQELNKITETSGEMNAHFGNFLESDIYKENQYRMQKIVKIYALRIMLLNQLDDNLQQISSDIPVDCIKPLLILAEKLKQINSDDSKVLTQIITESQNQISSNNSYFLSGIIPYIMSDKKKSEGKTRNDIINKLEILKSLGEVNNLVELATEVANPVRFKTAKSANSRV